jgi:hypothetical protein
MPEKRRNHLKDGRNRRPAMGSHQLHSADQGMAEGLSDPRTKIRSGFPPADE